MKSDIPLAPSTWLYDFCKYNLIVHLCQCQVFNTLH